MKLRSSNIPLARSYVRLALIERSRVARCRLLQKALSRMRRAPHLRRCVSPKRVVITWQIRNRVKYLARKYPNMTNHEIAESCGLRSSGRVTDILQGKR